MIAPRGHPTNFITEMRWADIMLIWLVLVDDA
jgi:hypothetical protein